MANYINDEAQDPIMQRPDRLHNYLSGANRPPNAFPWIPATTYPFMNQYAPFPNKQSYSLMEALSLASPFLNPTFVTQVPSLGARSSTTTGSRYTPSLQTPDRTTAVWQGVSPRYRGNRFAVQNQGADIPEEQSTSVWITNLPSTCTHADLLKPIRNMGKVYATVINPPQEGHATSAAKIVFFDVEGKNRLLLRHRIGCFIVSNSLPHVMSNRIRTAAQPPGPQCRVLIISGPATMVNQTFMCAWIKTFCVFELEYARDLEHRFGNATMEWAFGSYRCQAERVYSTIQERRREAAQGHSTIWANINVSWGLDPCDRQNV
ncbi:hypothetical protein E0Z10_g9164 [Xylaria hypoxylon]|uniref:RRM domain-containing protein n=1 Tax=Xylaria hypoxylon TaxID=37992 RepID=A0A4Z0Y6Z5_9PEZI|nr:hypothetical protein E0Z10_g9164 [Xylaria hypoxylon]